MTTLAQDVGKINQDDPVIDHHSQQDNAPCQRIGVEEAVSREDQRHKGSDGRQGSGKQQHKGRRQRLRHRSKNHQDKDKSRRNQEIKLPVLVLLVDHLNGYPGRQVIGFHNIVDFHTVGAQKILGILGF